MSIVFVIGFCHRAVGMGLSVRDSKVELGDERGVGQGWIGKMKKRECDGRVWIRRRG
jgi:hypothetical protein